MSRASVWQSEGVRRALPWSVPVFILLAWEVASKAGWLSSRVLPEPWSVATAFWTLAQAKQFAPDPNALTVYVVRRNWGDGRNFVKVQADDGAIVETLPNTMVRYRLKPGSHTLAFDVEGQRQTTTVEGKAGDMRFARINGMVWSWTSTFTWATETEDSIRERALKARLVADVAVR